VSDFAHPSDLDVLYNDLYGEYLIDGGGEHTYDRSVSPDIQGAVITSGRVHVQGFKAKRTETITRVSVGVGSQGASISGTRRIGIYLLSRDRTTYKLISNTANDTLLFAFANVESIGTLLTPFTKVRGEEYAVGIVVSTGTMPAFVGWWNTATPSNACACLRKATTFPLRVGVISNASLPATFTNASLFAANPLCAPVCSLLP
jgi:hypothetical protein